ncbi:type VII secretion target [Actinoplanes solisilvae]|uniref:type VII secretion target n=1 Tax=Actinoplanes solisilvae TaxID=2486853 RepID=UPI000FD9EE74|nr:type VII secretion target [Actinoplanes solisilvae]
MNDRTSIDAPAVHAIGEAVTGVAERLAAVTDRIPEWKRASQGAIEGAITCDVALVDAARRWAGTLDSLTALIRDHGGDLRAAAADYTAADSSAAERILGARP